MSGPFWAVSAAAAEHELPGDDGPVYQATHVTLGPGTPAATTAEAEAAIYVELEAMQLSGSQTPDLLHGDQDDGG